MGNLFKQGVTAAKKAAKGVISELGKSEAQQKADATKAANAAGLPKQGAKASTGKK